MSHKYWEFYLYKMVLCWYMGKSTVMHTSQYTEFENKKLKNKENIMIIFDDIYNDKTGE